MPPGASRHLRLIPAGVLAPGQALGNGMKISKILEPPDHIVDGLAGDLGCTPDVAKRLLIGMLIATVVLALLGARMLWIFVQWFFVQ